MLVCWAYTKRSVPLGAPRGWGYTFSSVKASSRSASTRGGTHGAVLPTDCSDHAGVPEGLKSR
eukprot:3188004-Rhodomonas_salina.1